jgi:chromosome segregation ATPase
MAFSAETAVSETAGAVQAKAEASELEKALQQSRAEADSIRIRNQKLAHRRQSLEKRIADLQEQLLQQEQVEQPVDDPAPAAPGLEERQEQEVSDGEESAGPKAQN